MHIISNETTTLTASIIVKLKIYLSNWYQPPCDSEKDMTDEKFGFVYDSDGPTKTLALNSHEDQTVMGRLCLPKNSGMYQYSSLLELTISSF